MKIVTVAACALVDPDGRVLIAQRPEGKPMAGLWEFPGGKVESGETPEQSLIRELEEELGIVVKEACLAPLTFASHSYPDFHLLMPLYICRRWEGTAIAKEGQKPQMGAAEPAAGLSDAARGRAAGGAPDDAALSSIGPKGRGVDERFDQVASRLSRGGSSRTSRARPRSNTP